MARILLSQSKGLETGIDKNTIKGTVDAHTGALLKKRSASYTSFFSKLDQPTLTETQGWSRLMDQVKNEFGTAELSSLPLGIVAKCYLGHPYEVHILDLSSAEIISHYKMGEPMPPAFERARNLAAHTAYAFVEVYNDKLLVIHYDGTVTRL